MAAIRVEPAGPTSKAVIRRLLELDAHDHSEFDGRDVNEHGEFGYRFLDHYWTESHRHPFLLRVGEQIAGCALVSTFDIGASMSEFFVLRKYRRQGVGRNAAEELFARFPGRWMVRQVAGNVAATAFWRSVIQGEFTEEVTDDGPVQRFTT